MFTFALFIVGVVLIVYGLAYMVGMVYAFISGVIQAERELKAERLAKARASQSH